MLTSIFQLLVSGLACGMVYALMAVGLVLLIRAVGTLNFAQGDILSMGAFVTYWLSMQLCFSTIKTVFSALIVFALFGILFMFTVYWPVRKSTWPQAIIICTMGASTVIEEVLMIIWGSRSLPMNSIMSGSFDIGGVYIEKQYIILICVSIIIIYAVFTLFDKLYCGRVMQAAAQDKYVATMIGIPTVLTTAITFIVVVAIVGFGGYLIAPLYTVRTSLNRLQLRAFAGVMVGGMGNLKGAIVGSLIIGLVEAYSTYLTTTYKDAMVFIVLLLMLIIKPSGLFGDLVKDKA